jgi:hypothetical protein
MATRIPVDSRPHTVGRETKLTGKKNKPQGVKGGVGFTAEQNRNVSENKWVTEMSSTDQGFGFSIRAERRGQHQIATASDKSEPNTAIYHIISYLWVFWVDFSKKMNALPSRIPDSSRDPDSGPRFLRSEPLRRTTFCTGMPSTGKYLFEQESDRPGGKSEILRFAQTDIVAVGFPGC